MSKEERKERDILIAEKFMQMKETDKQFVAGYITAKMEEAEKRKKEIV